MNQKMTRALFIFNAILCSVLSVNCSSLQLGTTVPDKRPNDFAVEYHWSKGSLPPPYHYEYAISIKPNGQSELMMVPNYPSESVSKWTEKFTVETEQLDKLYRVLLENKLFTRSWQQEKEGRTGGEYQNLTVTAGGKSFTLKDYLISEQQDSATAIYSAVNESVPKAIWDKLNAQREQYVKDNPRS